MKLYIFSSVKEKNTLPFKLFVINQNLKVTRLTSLLAATACAILLLSKLFYDYTYINNHILYRNCFIFLTVVSAIYFFITTYIESWYIGRRLFFKRFVGNSYPIMLIFSMMTISFINGRTPADNMTLFMFGLIFVAVSWLFSIRDIIIISIITYIGLSVGIIFFLPIKESIVTNQIAGFIIISGFYFISRMLYSYHANYFIQLKLIERNNHEITKMAQLKTEMLGIVAHDLRSPLNSISALVELSKNEKTTHHEREQYANMILEGCDEARNIIRDLILIVKGESSPGLQLKETNINLLLSQVQQHWLHRLRDDKQILLTLPENVITINIDEDKMMRVFDNLISNAIKFTQDNARIHLYLHSSDKGHARITVSDNGIGIPESIQPYLFDRFSKAGRLGLKGEKSHGLGLNICKQIIEQHGGKIALESAAGQGTHFHITLPLYKEAANIIVPEEQEIFA